MFQMIWKTNENWKFQEKKVFKITNVSYRTFENYINQNWKVNGPAQEIEHR